MHGGAVTAADQGELFRAQGFVVLRELFARDEIARLSDEIEAAQGGLEPGSGLDKDGLEFKHNLFLRSEALRDFISQPKLVHLLREIVGPDFWVRWDQAVVKSPGGAEFPWHQDNGYNGLLDEHFQFWVALNPMTPENGGLWLQPGSHRSGRLSHRAVDNHLFSPGRPETAEFIDAEVGDAVLFSSLMLHKTSPNETATPRSSYVVEYISLDHLDPFVRPPYFVVARGGEPSPEFVRYYRGRLSPRNQVRYLGPRLRRGVDGIGARLGSLVKRNGDQES
jgi:ectoine hydroxylase-related dioxygenase (phytanoyl-CoA dioxygenase family)